VGFFKNKKYQITNSDEKLAKEMALLLAYLGDDEKANRRLNLFEVSNKLGGKVYKEPTEEKQLLRDVLGFSEMNLSGTPKVSFVTGEDFFQAAKRVNQKP